MMIARAAKEGWPCPSDAAIARAYGSYSLRRARRLLTYIEEQGLIVCQLDGTGRRIVTLVELTWATAPGDPNAEELPAKNFMARAVRLYNVPRKPLVTRPPSCNGDRVCRRHNLVKATIESLHHHVVGSQQL